VYTRGHFYDRPLYMGHVYESLRWLIRSCENHTKSTEHTFCVPYIQLKRQFAKNYIVDYFVTKLELHSPVELLFLLPPIVSVNVDGGGVTVSIQREIDVAKDDIEIIYLMYWIVYQNRNIRPPELFQQLSELKGDQHDDAQGNISFTNNS